MADCIFCKIIAKHIPSTIVCENDHVLVIKDIHPKAPIHYLILSKKHIEHLGHVTPADEKITAALVDMVRHLSTTLPAPQAFNVVSNNGAAAGQSVPHLHWHFLAGKNIYSGGFAL